jgi:NADH-quinone oxidoreductase subunit L
MILAFLSIMAGYIGLPGYLGANRLADFLAPSFQWIREEAVVEHSHAEEFVLTVVAVLVAALGFLAAYQLYVRNRQLPEHLANRFSRLHRTIEHKFFVDELYDSVLVEPIRKISRSLLWKVIDVGVIDGLVNGTASFMLRCSHNIKRIQNGYARTYATWILGGAVFILLYYYLTAF